MAKFNITKPFVSLWEKGRYKLWRNVLVQTAMTAIAVGQLFFFYMFVALFSTIAHDFASGIIGMIFAVAAEFGLSALMVLLKGLGKSEHTLPAYWFVSWDKVTPQALNEVFRTVAQEYRGLPNAILSDNPSDSARVKCIEAINSVSWEKNEKISGKIKYTLRPWSFTITPQRRDFIKYTLLWMACSPIAFFCQVISLCVMFTSPAALRTVISTGADIPISMTHLPKKQKYIRFFFNAVSIEEFDQRAWLGKFDERK